MPSHISDKCDVHHQSHPLCALRSGPVSHKPLHADELREGKFSRDSGNTDGKRIYGKHAYAAGIRLLSAAREHLALSALYSLFRASSFRNDRNSQQNLQKSIKQSVSGQNKETETAPEFGCCCFMIYFREISGLPRVCCI